MCVLRSTSRAGERGDKGGVAYTGRERDGTEGAGAKEGEMVEGMGRVSERGRWEK